MRSSEFLFEAKKEVAKKKIDSLLDRLSDEDLLLAFKTLKNDLNESAKDFMDQKKSGKRIEGSTSDFIAYDDNDKTAKRFRETPSGLQVTNVAYKAGSPVAAQPKPAPTIDKAKPKKEEVESYVATLSKTDKTKLLKLLQAEAKERKSSPKKTQTKSADKKSHSGKYIVAVLLGLSLLGALQEPDSERSMPKASDSQEYQITYQRNKVKLYGKKFSQLDRLETELYGNIVNLVNNDPMVTRAEIYTGDYVGTTSVYLRTTYDASKYRDAKWDKRGFCHLGKTLASKYLEEIPNHRNKVGLIMIQSRTGEDIGTVSHVNGSYEGFKKYCLEDLIR